MELVLTVKCSDDEECNKVMEALRTLGFEPLTNGGEIRIPLSPQQLALVGTKLSSIGVDPSVERFISEVLSNDHGTLSFSINNFLKLQLTISGENILAMGVLTTGKLPMFFSLGNFKKSDIDKLAKIYSEMRTDFKGSIKKYVINRIDTYVMFRTLPLSFEAIFDESEYVKIGRKIILMEDILNKDIRSRYMIYWTAIWKDELDDYGIRTSVVGSLVRKSALETFKVAQHQFYIPVMYTKRLSRKENEAYTKLHALYRERIETINKATRRERKTD